VERRAQTAETCLVRRRRRRRRSRVPPAAALLHRRHRDPNAQHLLSAGRRNVVIAVAGTEV